MRNFSILKINTRVLNLNRITRFNGFNCDLIYDPVPTNLETYSCSRPAQTGRNRINPSKSGAWTGWRLHYCNMSGKLRRPLRLKELIELKFEYLASTCFDFQQFSTRVMGQACTSILFQGLSCPNNLTYLEIPGSIIQISHPIICHIIGKHLIYNLKDIGYVNYN